MIGERLLLSMGDLARQGHGGRLEIRWLFAKVRFIGLVLGDCFQREGFANVEFIEVFVAKAVGGLV